MMHLHDDKGLFTELALAASNELNISRETIEKDYYVSMILRQLHLSTPEFVFRGGTSLSKCYKIIDRFSEDIDLSIITSDGRVTEGTKRKLKQIIVDATGQLGLEIVNLAETRSRRDLNRYIVKYNSVYEETAIITNNIIIETFIPIRPFPTIEMPINSYVQEILDVTAHSDLLDNYHLRPFPMQVQDIRRTFIDKVFAICDYYINSDINKHSRHIYDIYKILPNIVIDQNFKTLISEVRNVRKNMSSCPSSHDGFKITECLEEIVSSGIYKKDYETITTKLLFSIIHYDEAIERISYLIENHVFDN